MKLSETQQHVIDRMRKGWQLGLSMGYDSCYWLQKGGCGKGGEAEDVRINTVYALLDRDIIVIDREGFPLRTYKLAESVK